MFYDLHEKYEEDFIDPSNAVSESSGHGNTRLRWITSMEMSTKWEVQVFPNNVSRLRWYRLWCGESHDHDECSLWKFCS